MGRWSLSLRCAGRRTVCDKADWLLARQSAIEKKVAQRDWVDGGQVLYDVRSSYYEGHTGPLAKFGHSRDAKRGKPIALCTVY